MCPFQFLNELREKDWINHMSTWKDKVLKVVLVTRYASLRDLFSFANMPSLTFYSQVFQQSCG